MLNVKCFMFHFQNTKYFYHAFCLQSTALINLKLINFTNSIVAVSLPGETVIGCLANGFISSVSER